MKDLRLSSPPPPPPIAKLGGYISLTMSVWPLVHVFGFYLDDYLLNQSTSLWPNLLCFIWMTIFWISQPVSDQTCCVLSGWLSSESVNLSLTKLAVFYLDDCLLNQSTCLWPNLLCFIWMTIFWISQPVSDQTCCVLSGWLSSESINLSLTKLAVFYLDDYLLNQSTCLWPNLLCFIWMTIFWISQPVSDQTCCVLSGWLSSESVNLSLTKLAVFYLDDYLLNQSTCLWPNLLCFIWMTIFWISQPVSDQTCCVLSGWLSSESVNLSLTKLAVFYLDDYLLNQSTCLWPNLLCFIWMTIFWISQPVSDQTCCVLSGWLSSESVNLSLTKLAVFYLDDYLLNQSTCLWPNLLCFIWMTIFWISQPVSDQTCCVLSGWLSSESVNLSLTKLAVFYLDDYLLNQSTCLWPNLLCFIWMTIFWISQPVSDQTCCVLSGWLSSESVNLSLTKLAVFYLDDYLLNQSTCLWPNLLWHSIILSQNMMCKNVMCKNVMCKNVLIFKVKCVLFYWLCGWNCTLKRIQNNCQTNSTWVEHYFSYFYCQAFSEWNILSAAFTVRPILPG